MIIFYLRLKNLFKSNLVFIKYLIFFIEMAKHILKTLRREYPGIRKLDARENQLRHELETSLHIISEIEEKKERNCSRRYLYMDPESKSRHFRVD